MDDKKLSFLMSEYSALREETLKRIEIQHQLLTLTLVAIGTFLGFGSTTALLLYPTLAFFLAAAWAQNIIRVKQIGEYIKTHIEEMFLDGSLGWQHNRGTTTLPAGRWLKVSGGSLSLLAGRGVFLGTQAVALIVSLLNLGKEGFNFENSMLLVLGVLASILTVRLLRLNNLVSLTKGNTTRVTKAKTPGTSL
ncbi:MAG TPA: hypothetical protein VF952_05875 [Chloroflexia bacterium]|jgi:hypothetical protein